MSTTTVEDKSVKKGSYSLTQYAGGTVEDPICVCLQFGVTNMERVGYKSEYHNYMQLNCAEAIELVKDLMDYIHYATTHARK